MRKSSGFLAIVILFLTLTMSSCRETTERHELGYQFHQWGERKGLIDTLPKGTVWYNPFFEDNYHIDMRPHQIRIEGNSRLLNAKLVKFRAEGFDQFISLHGVGDYRYYGTSNSASATSNDLGSILLSYAYEGIGTNNYDEAALQRKYKFLEILSATTSVNGAQDVILPAADTTLH